MKMMSMTDEVKGGQSNVNKWTEMDKSIQLN